MHIASRCFILQVYMVLLGTSYFCGDKKAWKEEFCMTLFH